MSDALIIARRDEKIAELEAEVARLRALLAKINRQEGTEVARLREALTEYGSHQSWRCDHPDRYPWDPDCPCGLVGTGRELGIDLATVGPAHNA